MIMKQFRYEPLAQASYLLGCPRAKEAVIVDPIDARPLRQPRRYLAAPRSVVILVES